jgi:hypothetical protein
MNFFLSHLVYSMYNAYKHIQNMFANFRNSFYFNNQEWNCMGSKMVK